MKQDYSEEDRIVMTLDAGGTNFVFNAMKGGNAVTEAVKLPAEPDDLEASLENIRRGFNKVQNQLSREPDAISFAFPGPADYERGIIGDLGNLPAYQGGVALGPMLEEHFEMPVIINNDGDLFAYGIAVSGYLDRINNMLEQSGSPKRYQNLLGLTLGTGFGAGIVSNGQIYKGDNSASGEIWLMRHKHDPSLNAEEGASIRGVRRFYARQTCLPLYEVPEPKTLYKIARGETKGDMRSARKAFELMGEIVGDAVANAITLLDGLIVFGGGLAGAHSLFLQSVVDELNSHYQSPDGNRFNRLVMTAYNLEDANQLEQFKKGQTREISIPESNSTISYDPEKRIGVGVTDMDTSRAISLGAYATAIDTLGD